MKFCLMGLLVLLTAGHAFGFALYGPLTAEPSWQIEEWGYQQVIGDGTQFGDFGFDIGTPRNIGEEYRWNTPYVYYSYDTSFGSYFGSNGVAAVDAAFAILNGALTNGVSSYSATLSEVPTDTLRINARATALGLLDIKSGMLSMLLEELGLADAIRWTWALHDRAVPTGGACPADVGYEVVQRNFDPLTGVPSSYVNGTLYTYTIIEFCTAAGPRKLLADAYEFQIDPLARSTAVAAAHSYPQGGFYTGLTRDDIGGLRYLLRTNNINLETTDSSLQQTSGGGGAGGTPVLQFLTTSNLSDLLSFASTNDLAAFQAAFPDIQVIGTPTPSVVFVTSSSTFAYFTNSPYAPLGQAVLVTGTTFTTNVQFQYTYNFGNVITNTYSTNGFVTVIQTNVAVSPYAPLNSAPTTNVTSSTSLQSFINGDYYLIPTNNCGFAVLSNLLTTVTPVSTTTVATNATGTTNLAGQSFAQTTIHYFTNHTLLVQITPCLTNSGTSGSTNGTFVNRQGIDRMQFIRRDFDSLVGTVTTNFTLTALVNGQLVVQNFRRTVSNPDFLIEASDLSGTGGAADGFLQFSPYGRSTPNFVKSGSISNGGPGIIVPSVAITFNRSGPLLFNSSPFFLTEASASRYVRLASYDGTTNAPVIYPDGTSIQNLENQAILGISPGLAPAATVGTAYSQVFTGQGGTPYYTFSLSPSSPALPSGLVFTGGSGVASGSLSGTPAAGTAGTYDFVIRMVDQNGRQVDISYPLTVNP